MPLPIPSNFNILIGSLQAEHDRQVNELKSQIHVLNTKLANTAILAPALSPTIAPAPASCHPPAHAPCPSDPHSDIAKLGVTETVALKGTILEEGRNESDIMASDIEELRGNIEIDSSASFDEVGKNGEGSMEVENPNAQRKTKRASQVNLEVFPALYIKKRTSQIDSGVRKSVRTLVESTQFEVLSMCLIFLNTTTMFIAIQYDGHGYAHSLGVKGYHETKEDRWPHLGEFLEISEKVFVVFFTIEVILRMAAFQLLFFRQFLHWLDLVIVISGLADWIAGNAFDPTMLRLLRFVKVARILRSFNNPRFLDALYFLTASIRASISVLMWSLVLLTVIQCIAALSVCQILSSWFQDATKSPASTEVFIYYGTFTRSLLTLFEILMANWITPCRVLSNHVGEYVGALVLVYRCVGGFAVLNVISAVFINQTMKIMSQDTDIMLIERGRAEKKFKQNLMTLFSLLDLSHDGHVSQDELNTRLQDPEVHFTCFRMGLSVHDIEDIVHLCNMSNEGMAIHEFIQAAHDVRKQANTLDVARLLARSRNLSMEMAALNENFAKLVKRFDSSYPRNTTLPPQAERLA